MKKSTPLPNLYHPRENPDVVSTKAPALVSTSTPEKVPPAPTSEKMPTPVPTPEGEEIWPPELNLLLSQRIAVGENHTAVIHDGRVFCWGCNKYGQLGIEQGDEKDEYSETIISCNRPLTSVKLPAAAVSVATGQHYTLALLEDGQVFSWGDNRYGQLGLRKSKGIQYKATPSGPIPLRVRLKPLSPDPEYPSLLRALIPKDFPPDVHPIPLSLVRISAPPEPLPDAPPSPPLLLEPIVRTAGLVAAESHSCLLREDGQLFCWGGNEFGCLGFGNTDSTRRPTIEIPLPDRVMQVAVGQSHTAVLLRDGRVFSWGFNGDGQLGLGHCENTLQPTKAIKFQSAALMVSCGFSHTAVLLETGEVFCWGWNYHGRLGLGHEENRHQPDEPVKLPGKAIAVEAGWDFTCALLEDGRVFGWGNNSQGQLGLNTLRPAEGFSRDKYGYYCVSPTRSVDLPQPAVAIAAGTSHVAVLLENDQIFCWGGNQSGQLGIGDNEGTLGPNVPIRLP